MRHSCFKGPSNLSQCLAVPRPRSCHLVKVGMSIRATTKHPVACGFSHVKHPVCVCGFSKVKHRDACGFSLGSKTLYQLTDPYQYTSFPMGHGDSQGELVEKWDRVTPSVPPANRPQPGGGREGRGCQCSCRVRTTTARGGYTNLGEDTQS